MDTATSTVDPDGLPRRISPPATLGKKRHGIVRGENQRYYKTGNQHQQRRGHDYQQGQEYKRQKFHHKNHNTISNGNNGKHFSNGGDSSNSNTCSISSDPTKKNSVTNYEPMDLDPIFPKLDQTKIDHAKRIQTRRKTVAMGKNTAGYFEYTKKVPKHKRKPRSMETPSTPDHTLDIPARRWLGMVKAWRKALHQYDPADLLQDTTGADNQKPKSHPNNNTSSNNHKGKGGGDIQSLEIENAIAKGLLVDVSTPPPRSSSTISSQSNEVDSLVGTTPFSILSEDKPSSSEGCHDAIVDLEGTAFADGCSGSFADDDDDDDDSDDDLL